ncbi:MAG: exodeoxyribonuclease VII large subunit [Christensenellales bacterium]
MSENYYSVSQLNNYIVNIFEAEIMLQNICVYGEVSSFSVSNNIAYFNLKDQSGMLSCVLFGANQFDKPNIGDVILVRGSMNYYAKGGRLSFNAVSIMPYGKGLLYEKFLQLKNELESRGYFAEEHKKLVPRYVRRVGVVSSETGAVIRDIINVTHRRNDTIDIVLFPVKVQGIGADKEIAKAIDFFSQYDKVDVVIVARGGGSMEDLEPFNTEIVATATYNCKKPIISAVGHETDFTIIDFVADKRASTPSVAAEFVAWDKSLELEKIYNALGRLDRSINSKIKNINLSLNYNINKMQSTIGNIIWGYENKLDKSVSRLNLIDGLIDKKSNLLDKLNLKLEGFNPSKIANMGYSKVIQNDKVISSIMKLDKMEPITISMIDGNIQGDLR